MTTNAPGGEEARTRFLEAVADVRPRLHRYCARMTGSVVDGEDVVQDTLQRAYEALAELSAMPALEPWLFRIAHHRIIDLSRRYERRMGEPIEDADHADRDAVDPEEALARADALKLAVSRFVELVPMQRSCVVLKDVLGHSVDEIVSLLESTEPAVKAALHRGREKLLRLSAESPRPAQPRALSPSIVRYAQLFNAGDWDALRAMLADDVRLDLTGHPKRRGRADVGQYFTNYARADDVTLAPARVEGEEALVAYRKGGDERPVYFIVLTLVDGAIDVIRDFRYVPYIMGDVELELV